MKVSGSVLSDSPGRTVRSGSHALTYGLAAAWLLAHLPFLSPALEDIDSINFALGLHHYDPALHQPHPPGYPVFIAVGRLALVVVHALAPGLTHVQADALALAIWSALGGALAIVAIASLFRELTSDPTRANATAGWGAALVAATPLFWLTGLRPMSDMFGLGVALAAQALLLRGARDGRGLTAGALIAGLAAGIRTQTVPLTFPLFFYALYVQRRQGTRLARPIAALVAGGVAWGVPLLVLTGGIDGYLRALGSQAGEDFAWVDMLWVNPTPRAIAMALYDSFVLPYGSPALGILVGGVAAIGGLVLLVRDRRALALLAIAFLPYAMFHLLFQEAANLRYATPLVPLVLYPVVRAFVAWPHPRRAWPIIQTPAYVPLLVLFIAGLLQPSVSAGVLYGREVHPAFRAIADMQREAANRKPGAVFSHFALRRPLQAAPTALPVVEARRNYEWLGPEEYWLTGGREPVWFLADPLRTDLALIDPQVRQPRQRTEYLWSVGGRPELMGTRPLAVDWYRFDPPGWFAAEGWELTPETAGIARASHTRLHQRPITAHVRRRNEPMAAIIAGRDLGRPGGPASVLDLAIDGHVVESWRVDPATGSINFFHVMQLPQGVPAGPGTYATLTITARAESPGVPTPEVAVEQFDIQPVNTVMFGFGEGWQEAEYNNRTGLAWRWTSERATVRILPARTVAMVLRGESPLKYFDAAPTVRIRAGARELAVFRPVRDFTWNVYVPEDALVASGGLVTIETDKVYLPGQVEGTADARRLGLRIFETRVMAAVP